MILIFYELIIFYKLIIFYMLIMNNKYIKFFNYNEMDDLSYI